MMLMDGKMNRSFAINLLVTIVVNVVSAIDNDTLGDDSTRYVPNSAFATVTIRLGLIDETLGLKLVPFDPILHQLFYETGIDFRQVDTVTYVLSRHPKSDEAHAGFICSFKEKIDGVEYFQKTTRSDSINVTDIDGTKIMQIDQCSKYAIQVSEKTVVISDEEHFALIMSESKAEKTDLTQLIRDNTSETLLCIRIATATISDWAKQSDQVAFESMKMDDQIEYAMSGEHFIRRCKTISLDFDWNEEGVSLNSKFETKNSETAKELRKEFNSMLDLIPAAYETETKQLESGNGIFEEEAFGWAWYLTKVSRYVRKSLQPSVKGNRMIIQHRDKDAGQLITVFLTLYASQGF